MIRNYKRKKPQVEKEKLKLAVHSAFCAYKFMFRGHTLNSDRKENFFTRPFNSCYLNVFSYDTDSNTFAANYDFSLMKSKLFCLQYQNKFVFLPLLHTL